MYLNGSSSSDSEVEYPSGMESRQQQPLMDPMPSWRKIPTTNEPYENYETFSKKRLQAESQGSQLEIQEKSSTKPYKDSTHSNIQQLQPSFFQGKSGFTRHTLEDLSRYSMDKTPIQKISVGNARTRIIPNIGEEPQTSDRDNKIRQLLELEIKKNKELQHTLFVREKQIMELKTKINQNKSPRRQPHRSISPRINPGKTVKKIEDEIRGLKEKYQHLQRKHPSENTEKLKKQNDQLKRKNRKLEKFFKAMGETISIVSGKMCAQDPKDVWQQWRNIFPGIAQQIKKKQSL